jgi:hypothetical protein
MEDAMDRIEKMLEKMKNGEYITEQKEEIRIRIDESIINLMEETLSVLTRYNKSTLDVNFVIWKENYKNNFKYCTFSEFLVKAKDINYDNGHTTEIINNYIKIVGDTWWLERSNYDGAEWWEYKTIPSKPNLYDYNINMLNNYN